MSFNKGNNGGGNPNHDEKGRFTSAGGARSGNDTHSIDEQVKSMISKGKTNLEIKKWLEENDESGEFDWYEADNYIDYLRGDLDDDASPEESDDEIIDKSLKNLIDYAKSAGLDNPVPNENWSDELGYQLKNDGVPEEKIEGLVNKFVSRMKNQKIMDMGFGPEPQGDLDEERSWGPSGSYNKYGPKGSGERNKAVVSAIDELYKPYFGDNIPEDLEYKNFDFSGLDDEMVEDYISNLNPEEDRLRWKK